MSKIPRKQFELNHIITSSIEHDAVLEPLKDFEENGLRVTYLPVDEHGLVNPDDITKSINEQTTIVSIMLANNEVGTIQPFKKYQKFVTNIKYHYIRMPYKQ